MEGMWQRSKEIFYLRKVLSWLQIFGLNVRSSSVVKTNFFLDIVDWFIDSTFGNLSYPVITKFLFSFENRGFQLAYGISIMIISVLFDIENYFCIETIINWKPSMQEKDEMLIYSENFIFGFYLTSVIILTLTFFIPQLSNYT